MTRRRFLAAAGAPLLAATAPKMLLIHGDADVDGIRFPNTFRASGSRDACLSVLYTGLYNHSTGQYGDRGAFGHFHLHPHVRTIHELLHVDEVESSAHTPGQSGMIVVYGRQIIIRTGDRSGIDCTCVNEADILPTVLDWAGIAPPYPLHGRSLMRPPECDYAFYSHTFTTIDCYGPVRGVRTSEYEYMLSLLPGGKETLTRQGKLVDDPPTLRRLRAATEAFRRRTNDPWLSTAPYLA